MMKLYDLSISNGSSSASVDDWETMLCFFDFQDIIESPMKMKNPISDLQVSIQPAQSILKKTWVFKDCLADKNIPWTRLSFRYHKRWLATYKCGNRGLLTNWLKWLTA